MGNKSHEELPLLAVPAAASPATSPSAKAAAPPSPLPLEDAPLVPLRLQGVLMVAISALLFSILSAFVKLESYSMPSMETVFWRSSIAWLLCLIVMRFYNLSVFVERQFWPALTARCFFGTCAMSLSFYAMQQMVLADASVLLATSPVTTFFLGAVLLGEHIDPISLCFALLSFVGVTCVSRPTWLFGAHAEDAATKAGTLVGALCCLLSATSVSFVYVSMRRLQQLHFLVVIHYFSLTATIASLVPLLWQGTFVVHMTPTTWLASVGSGVVGFVGQLFLTRGFQLEKAGVASVMSYLNVVFVFIWDFVFLHETINPWSIVGAAIICGCAIMIVLRRMNHK